MLPSCPRVVATCLKYRICAEVFPEWEELLCGALELACLSREEWGVGQDWRTRVGDCVSGMSCVVEHMYLTAEFARSAGKIDAFYVPENIRPKRPSSTQGWWDRARLVETFPANVRALDRLRGTRQRSLIQPLEDNLPALGIYASILRRAANAPSPNDVAACLSLVDEPLVFTGSAAETARRAAADVERGRFRYSLDELSRSRRLVEVRASPSNVFVFCRSAHSSIARGQFTPPSVVKTIPEAEFAARCAARGREADLEPCAFDGGKERVYMQSLLPLSECLLEPLAAAKPGIAVTQLERVWVSTKGSVSALHYDASHSVLVQVCGRKRMIFFPPPMLPMLGIYPLGHPLHRRARLDISEERSFANAKLFCDFWAALSSEDPDYVPVEVVLEPGDACTFPPGWAHYTESLDYSVSHTFRFTKT